MSRHDLRISQRRREMAPTQATHLCLRGLLPFWDYFITGSIRNQDWQNVFKNLDYRCQLPCHLARPNSGSPWQYVLLSSPYMSQSSSSSWKCQRLSEGSRAARGGRPLRTCAGSQAPLQVPPWTPSIEWWTGVDVSVTVCQLMNHYWQNYACPTGHLLPLPISFYCVQGPRGVVPISVVNYAQAWGSVSSFWLAATSPLLDLTWVVEKTNTRHRSRAPFIRHHHDLDARQTVSCNIGRGAGLKNFQAFIHIPLHVQ